MSGADERFVHGKPLVGAEHPSHDASRRSMNVAVSLFPPEQLQISRGLEHRHPGYFDGRVRRRCTDTMKHVIELSASRDSALDGHEGELGVVGVQEPLKGNLIGIVQPRL